MASTEPASSHEQTKPLEDKVADLKLEDKAGKATDAVADYVTGVKDAAKISAKDAVGQLNEAAEKASEEAKAREKQTSGAEPREVDIAHKEVEKSPDEGAYAVPTVDHRSAQKPDSDKTEDVPTAVVHENADSTESTPQQGKGIMNSITRSVKNVFSGIGSKGTKTSETKGEAGTD